MMNKLFLNWYALSSHHNDFKSEGYDYQKILFRLLEKAMLHIKSDVGIVPFNTMLLLCTVVLEAEHKTEFELSQSTPCLNGNLYGVFR